MADQRPPDISRLEELLIDKTLVGLSDVEQIELNELLESSSGVDAEEFERIAADVELSQIDGENLRPLDANLLERIVRDAKNSMSDSNGFSEGAFAGDADKEIRPVQTAIQETPPTRPARITFGDLAPWIITAACLVMLFQNWSTEAPDRPAPELSVAEQRADLLQKSENLTQVEWAPGPTAVEGAGGDIVWDGNAQQGYMRFTNLPENDPSKEQYQLWIFDRNQKEETPVDGGVFNITDASEQIVPIRPKLEVEEAYLFAVTIEKPGGVVVSNREQLPLLAQVE